MKISGLAFASALGMLFAAPAVHADTISFSISGADTGFVSITESTGTISAISGTLDGSTINTLVAAGGIGNNDNVFSSTQPFVDNAGVSFSLNSADSNGFTFVNLFSVAGSYTTCQGNTDEPGHCGGIDPEFGPDSMTQATPEPSALLGTALGGAGIIGLALRRRLLL